MEEWKDIPNYEGCYQASTEGRIKSLARTVNTGFGGKREVNERILSPSSAQNNKYRMVGLSNGTIRMFTVHQLVAITFLGHVPDRYNLAVDHINENRYDNRLANLQIITHKENSIKAMSSWGSTKFTVMGASIPCGDWETEYRWYA